VILQGPWNDCSNILFIPFCLISGQDWCMHKLANPWILPTINNFPSKISAYNWDITPNYTHYIEPAHAGRNTETAIGAGLELPSSWTHRALHKIFWTMTWFRDEHFCQLWSIFLTTLAQQLLMKLMLYHPFVCHRLRLLLPGWPTRPRSATKGREERRNPCVDPANMIDGTRRRFKSRRALGDGSM
jgi:hypothetical protein